MKKYQMLNTMILLIFSWVVFFLGLALGVYLMIQGGNNAKIFLLGAVVIIAGGVFGALIRMAGNIGQILFDSQNLSREILTGIYALNRGVFQLGHEFSQANDLLGLINRGVQDLQQRILQINQEISNGNNSLTRIIEGINDERSDWAELKNILVKINGDSQDRSRKINDIMTLTKQEILETNKEIRELKNVLLQVNCDSHDLNQDIHKIMSFFELIEQHLALKR
jgi:chromosome segregation ATPase